MRLIIAMAFAIILAGCGGPEKKEKLCEWGKVDDNGCCHDRIQPELETEVNSALLIEDPPPKKKVKKVKKKKKKQAKRED